MKPSFTTRRPAYRFALALTVAALAPPAARAQVAPAGALFDLQMSHPAPLSAYEAFGFSFVATLSATQVTFSFRNDPNFFYFDDAAVMQNGSLVNLLQNPGFESSALCQTAPSGWTRTLQPSALAGGSVGSVDDPAHTYCNVPHGGARLWCDGTVFGYSNLSQTLTTTPGATYHVSFWLGADAAFPVLPSPPETNVYAYATGGQPVAPAIPEPQTYLLMLAGAAAVWAAVGRRRRR